MELDFGMYLEEGTKKILEIVSSFDVSEEEKGAIIEAFSNELLNNIGNTSNMQDYESLLYGTSVKFIDRKISNVLADQNSSYSDYENAIKFCQRQQDLLALFKDNNWMLPAINNQNIEKVLITLKKSQESASICNKVIDEDKQIDELFRSAQVNLSVKACDIVIEKISELEENMVLCKAKKIPLPPINNKGTKSIRKRVANLRKDAEQKEALHQSIFDVDFRIHSIMSLQNTTQKQWQEIIGLCQKQAGLLSECSKNCWPLPQIKYGNPNEVADRYNLYLEMISIDSQLLSERNTLSSNKQYRNYYANCEKQRNNIEICNRNEWDVPMLSVSDPYGMLNIVHGEKSKKDKAKKVKGYFIKAGVICVCTLMLVSFSVYKYREGKIQIPFDPSYVSGEELQDIYDELDDAGFENITKRPDDSGWLNSGGVIGVTIDNSSSYGKGDYKKPDVNVVITYSSEGRVFVTNLLKGWQSADYKTIQNAFKQAGFTNIIVKEVVTSDKGKDKLTAALSLNGDIYTNENCYLPKSAPIVISYYALKIGIGNDSSQFIGQDYETVVYSLKESGFTNVQTQKITTGWVKGNAVVGVTVNNVETYNSSESFDPDVKIVVKYSSDDRINATSILENWQTKDYEQLRSALKAKGSPASERSCGSSPGRAPGSR